jgi:multicomponent Na+:H+ antiporter subunit D
MVVGIGLGTELGLNGAVAHAFADILFKGLLFMSMGAVLLRVGTVKATELGGLHKSMPWTTVLCIVGAASISAFPLFSGFATKSMIMTSVAQEGYTIVWFLLLFASAGVFHHAGIKIPFFAFFAHDSGKRCREAPAHMLIAMTLAAALCIGIGVFPAALYSLLPMPMSYEPYTASHVLAQLQLLIFSALAFSWLMRSGIYPPELRSINLDADWLYRGPGLRLVLAFDSVFQSISAAATNRLIAASRMGAAAAERLYGRRGLFARTSASGSMAISIMFMLLAFLLSYYFA